MNKKHRNIGGIIVLCIFIIIGKISISNQECRTWAVARQISTDSIIYISRSNEKYFDKESLRVFMCKKDSINEIKITHSIMTRNSDLTLFLETKDRVHISYHYDDKWNNQTIYSIDSLPKEIEEKLKEIRELK